MKQNRQGIWKFNFMTEWPTVFQLNAWGINPDGTPDLTRVFGDPDEDGILDRLSPVSLLENVVNVTDYPLSPFVAYQIDANDGNLRYTLTPIGLRRNQMIIYFLLMFVPLFTSLIGVLSYRHVFYAVKLNEVGKPENRSILPTYIRPSVQFERCLAKANISLFSNSKDDRSSMTDTSEYDSVDVFQLGSGNRRRTVLIATMEYYIEDWGIKIKIGGLGVMAQLMGKHLAHQDLIWVIPCVGGINYPVDYRAEPMRIRILGEQRIVQVYYHQLRNITYVCLDAPIFRSQSKKEPYPARMDDIESAIYYSAWNSCIAETMKRFPVDLYHINDYHGAIAPLHLLPQIVPCCLSLHNAEFQGLWAIRNPEEMEEIASVYNLSQEIVKQYVQFGEVFNLLHGAVSYLRVWQRGYGAAGVSAKYGKRSFARYPIFWGLSKIDSLPNPDPSDTADWNNELPKMADTKIDPEAEAARAGLKHQAQEWANLDANPEAELFVFVGRWSMQKGVDLIADIFPAVLEEDPRTQLICVGPVIDLYGRFAALKLEKLMELYPGRVYSKPEFTALPPFIFSGAEFALIPSRDEPFGLVAVEFGRKGALGVGSRVGGLGNMPGWWFTVESTTTKHLLRQFKSAIRAALASKPTDRARMRARSAIQRFPVAHWKQQLATMHEVAIKVNQKAAIKHGIELRGEYNTSLPSSGLPSSNASAAETTPPLSMASEKAGEQDDDLEDLPRNDASSYDITPPAEGNKRLSLGVRTGPGNTLPPKSTSRIIRHGVNQGSFSIGTKHQSDKSHNSTDKRGSVISQRAVESNLSSRTSSPIMKRRQSRVNTVRSSIAHALARFRFGDAQHHSYSGPRLTGDTIFDEKAQDRVQTQVQRRSDEVFISLDQARENKKMSMINTEQARLSVLKWRTNVPDPDEIIREAIVQQLPSDAYLALIGKSRDDENIKRPNSGVPSSATSSHPSQPRTTITQALTESSAVRDFATIASPPAHDQPPATTFETKRGTITFGGSSGVTSMEHPTVQSNRFSYGTVLQGKKDYALQNVEPFFTDPTGLYYKAFHLELKDLNSKNSESALCIEDFLTMSEKDWYNRLHKVKMGRRASTARPASVFHTPLGRVGSVGSIFNESVESVAVPDNSAEQFLLREQYEPPRGLKKLLLRRPRQWPFYSFLLAFVSLADQIAVLTDIAKGQIIAANSYQVTLISGQVGQSANMLYIIASIYLATSILWWILFRTLKSIYVLSIPFGFYGLAFLLLGIAAYSPGIARGWIQNVATGIYATASSSGAFYFALNFGSEGMLFVPLNW
ncbi:MAG: hypothetical protein LQ352_005095 [Teloschistes flavicans]|nr:MAG: hypothetical protein LQ352_005095 [Teloschistes flavicans]